MTNNMSKFINKNNKYKVVEGGWISSDGGDCYTRDDFNNSLGVKYRFTDGKSITLSKEDINSCKDYKPVWDI